MIWGHATEIMTSPIIYSKTWAQHFTLTTGAKCRWQCNGDTQTHVVHAQLGNYLCLMSTTNLISHTLDILKLISSKGLTVTIFISTILNYKHFLDEKLKLESAIMHTPTGDVSPEALALHLFILDSSMLIYCHGTTSLLPFSISFFLHPSPLSSFTHFQLHLILSACPLTPPHLLHLPSNSSAYSCNHAMSTVRLALD